MKKTIILIILFINGCSAQTKKINEAKGDEFSQILSDFIKNPLKSDKKNFSTYQFSMALEKRLENGSEFKDIEIQSILNLFQNTNCEKSTFKNEIVFLTGFFPERNINEKLLNEINSNCVDQEAFNIVLAKKKINPFFTKVLNEYKIHDNKSLEDDYFKLMPNLHLRFTTLLYINQAESLEELKNIFKINIPYYKYSHSHATVTYGSFFSGLFISLVEDDFLRKFFNKKYGNWENIETDMNQEDIEIINNWIDQNLEKMKYRYILFPSPL